MASNSQLVMPESTDPLFRQLAQLIGRDMGLDQWGSQRNHVAYESDTDYAEIIKNQGTGGHLNIPGILQVQDAGVTINALTVSGLTTTATLQVNDDANINDDLSVGDTTTTNALSVTLNGFIGQDLTVTRDLTVGRNTALGDATTDAVTVIAGLTIRSATATETALFVDPTTNAQVVRIGTAAAPLMQATVAGAAKSVQFGSGSAIPLVIDATNNRALFGSATALGSAADDKLSVILGTAHIATPSTALALAMRYGLTGQVIGMGPDGATNPDMPITINGTEVVRVGSPSSTYQLDVTGDGRYTDDLLVHGDLTVDGVLNAGTIVFTSLHLTGALDADGGGNFDSGVTITAGGIGVTGSSSFTGAVSFVSGGLTHIAGNIGVFNASAVGQQTVTGSRGGNLALASFLTKMANYGWIIDSTTV